MDPSLFGRSWAGLGARGRHWGDIVRSGIVRDYIMTKEMMGLK